MLPADGAVEGAAEGPVISDEQRMAFKGQMLCVVWAVVARGCVEFVAVPVGAVSSKKQRYSKLLEEQTGL